MLLSAPNRHALGLGFIFAVAFIWIITSFITGSLVTSTDTHAAAIHPFLLTYLATSLFTLYLPLIHLSAWASELWEGYKPRSQYDALQSNTIRSGQLPQGSASPAAAGERQATSIRTMVTPSIPMYAAAWAVPFWFLAQWSFNASLAITSVTSNTILSSTSSLFTFFLSIFLLGEAFTSRKLIAIAACILGTALVTLSDSETGDDKSGGSGSLLGDALALVSAALYASYTVLMRKKMPGEEAEAHIGLFFGYLGLFNTVFLAPLVVLGLSTDVFSLSTIPRETYLVVVLEGLLDYVLSDYLWARAVMLIGPTVATLGLSVQIPMAAAADLFLGKARWIASGKDLAMTLCGIALIMSGFFGINLGGRGGQGGDPSVEDSSQIPRKRKSSDSEATSAFAQFFSGDSTVKYSPVASTSESGK